MQKISNFVVENLERISLKIFACLSAYTADFQAVSKTGIKKTVLLKKEEKSEKCFDFSSVQIALACYNRQARAMGGKELIAIPCHFISDKLTEKGDLSGKKQGNFYFEIALLSDARDNKSLAIEDILAVPKSALRRQHGKVEQTEKPVQSEGESLPNEQALGTYIALRTSLLKGIEDYAKAYFNAEPSKLNKFIKACSDLLDKRIERYTE